MCSGESIRRSTLDCAIEMIDPNGSDWMLNLLAGAVGYLESLAPDFPNSRQDALRAAAIENWGGEWDAVPAEVQHFINEIKES